MSSLIEIENLITKAKKQGVDFGKGDPYNRLRYYTKIGWLPNMSRKKNKSGDVTGHYPIWVLDRLIMIDKLKEDGLTNEEITSKINTRNTLKGFYDSVNSDEFKQKVTTYIILFSLLLILFNELDIINLSKSKNKPIIGSADNVPAQITDSGVAFVPANRNVIFVKNNNITAGSKVYVTFNQNFSPATKYWVSKIEAQKGFYVELDAPVFDNVDFSWWISQ